MKSLHMSKRLGVCVHGAQELSRVVRPNESQVANIRIIRKPRHIAFAMYLRQDFYYSTFDIKCYIFVEISRTCPRLGSRTPASQGDVFDAAANDVALCHRDDVCDAISRVDNRSRQRPLVHLQRHKETRHVKEMPAATGRRKYYNGCHT